MVSGRSIYQHFAEYSSDVEGDVTTGFGSECLWFIPENLPCNMEANNKNDVICDKSHTIDSPVSALPSKKPLEIDISGRYMVFRTTGYSPYYA